MISNSFDAGFDGAAPSHGQWTVARGRRHRPRHVLAAFLDTPREAFVAPAQAGFAYLDSDSGPRSVRAIVDCWRPLDSGAPAAGGGGRAGRTRARRGGRLRLQRGDSRANGREQRSRSNPTPARRTPLGGPSAVMPGWTSSKATSRRARRRGPRSTSSSSTAPSRACRTPSSPNSPTTVGSSGSRRRQALRKPC